MRDGEAVGDAHRLLQIAVVVGVGDLLYLRPRVNAEQLHFKVALPFGCTAIKYATYGTVALPLGSYGDGSGKCAVLGNGGVCADAHVMVFRRGERRVHQVGPFWQPHQVALLLLCA